MNLYLYQKDQVAGPYPISEIESGLSKGWISPHDMACREGSEEWAPLLSLLNRKAQTPPPVPKAESWWWKKLKEGVMWVLWAIGTVLLLAIAKTIAWAISH